MIRFAPFRIILTAFALLVASMQVSQSNEFDIAIHKSDSDTFVVRWNEKMAEKFMKIEPIGTAYEGHVFIQYEKGMPLVVTGLKFTYASRTNQKTSIRIKFRDQSFIVTVDKKNIIFGKESNIDNKP